MQGSKTQGAKTFVIVVGIALAWCASAQYGRSQTDDGGASSVGAPLAPKLGLTAAQRNAIYQAVSKDRSKIAPRRFPAVVGADVPPMIELYALRDDAVSGNPAAKFYQYTMVQDQVVLVDPTTMRVIDVIGPTPQQ
jgi:hypothetical protein